MTATEETRPMKSSTAPRMSADRTTIASSFSAYVARRSPRERRTVGRAGGLAMSQTYYSGLQNPPSSRETPPDPRCRLERSPPSQPPGGPRGGFVPPSSVHGGHDASRLLRAFETAARRHFLARASGVRE